MRYALSQRSGETYDAAGKAMRDVFTILDEKGFKTIWSMPKSCRKIFKILDLPYLALFLLLKAGRRDYIFYSIPENKIKIKLLDRLRKIKGFQVICFINDLNAFRYGNMDSPEVKRLMAEEAALIGVADHVLAPNVNTTKLLRSCGVKSNLVPVGVWDYIMKEAPKAGTEGNKHGSAASCSQLETGSTSGGPDISHNATSVTGIRIAFAGNLNKSEFLFQMAALADDSISLELWGKLDEDKKQDIPIFAKYHGVLPAEEVPNAIAGLDYGLVWDGSGKDEIEGGLGEYLQYNNSHKCGLYLASGIPAIVWSKSGMADFIEKNGCGIVIDRLSDISERLKAADGAKLRENTAHVAEKLRKGAYLSAAFEEILN